MASKLTPYLLLAAGGVIALAAAPVVATSVLVPVTQVLAGTSLTGGGTGPTVKLGVVAGGITNTQIRDGTVGLDDLSDAAEAALKGNVGPRGPQGLTGEPGPAGPAGPPGPAGGSLPSSTAFSIIPEDTWPITTDGDGVVTPLTQTFPPNEPHRIRFTAHLTIQGGPTAADYSATALLNGWVLTSNYFRLQASEWRTIDLQRMTGVGGSGGADLLQFSVHANAPGATILHSGLSRPTYVETEIQ